MRHLLMKILICALLICYSLNVCYATTIETQLSRDQINLGDSIFVTYLLVNNTSRIRPDFSALQTDFRILNSNYGNAVTMVNGVSSTQTFWRLQLEPKKAGELIIPAITFGNDKSAAQKLMVTATQFMQNSAPSSSNDKHSVPIFVRSEINHSSPYVQSQLIYTFKLFFRTQLRNPRVEIPQMKDVTILPLADHPGYQTAIKGEIYNVIEKTMAIFPKKPGAITLPALQFHAFTIDENISAFDDPFNFDEPKKIALATKEMNLSVRDVPLSYPSTTWLPAKNITLTEQWSHAEQWELGAPVTRTLTIKAQGLRADQLPDFSISQIQDVNIYADKPKRSNNIKNDIVEGELQQKITYIPNAKQSFTIPPVKIHWWNTETDKQDIAQLREIHIQVNGGNAVPNSIHTVLPKVTHLNTAPDSTPAKTSFKPSLWFWIACIFLIGWVITLLLLLRRKYLFKHPEKEIVTEKPWVQSDKDFEDACHTGDAKQAKQYLLDWAKNEWQDSPNSLASLGECIDDEAFQVAIKELEQALYANQFGEWDGKGLLSAFQRIKKQRKRTKSKEQNFTLSDPLPPLNPPT